MKGHQGVAVATDTCSYAIRHGAPDSHIVIIALIAITAEDPDDILLVLVSAANPLSVDPCIFSIEDLGAFSPGVLEHLVAPCRKEPNVQTQFLRFPDDEVDMPEVCFTWLRRIVVFKRDLAIRIGIMQPIEFGKRNGLDNGKAFLSPVLQVHFSFLAREAME